MIAKIQIKHPLFGAVTVLRNTRARRISVSVRPPAQIRLSLPPQVPVSEGLRFMDVKSAWIIAALDKAVKHAPKTQPASPQEIENLRCEAKRRLPAMCDELSKLTGLKYRSVGVRVARTRWGSCSSRNDISLSIFLVELPDELIRYVILHELCHIKHKNHSPRFHAMLDALLEGREKELCREIRKYRPR